MLTYYFSDLWLTNCHGYMYYMTMCFHIVHFHFKKCLFKTKKVCLLSSNDFVANILILQSKHFCFPVAQQTQPVLWESGWIHSISYIITNKKGSAGQISPSFAPVPPVLSLGLHRCNCIELSKQLWWCTRWNRIPASIFPSCVDCEMLTRIKCSETYLC